MSYQEALRDGIRRTKDKYGYELYMVPCHICGNEIECLNYKSDWEYICTNCKRKEKEEIKIQKILLKAAKIEQELNQTDPAERYKIKRPEKLDGEQVMLSDEALKAVALVDKKSGVYRLYDNSDNIVYVGKSYDLNRRVQESFEFRNAVKFDFAVFESKADTDLYEIYYINKYHPILNGGSNSDDKLSIELPEIKFTEKYC